jgi:hypothetical protein
LSGVGQNKTFICTRKHPPKDAILQMLNRFLVSGYSD